MGKRHFVRWILYLGISFFLVLGQSSFSGAADKAGPYLEIALPEYDAGRVGEGETISHAFEVKNTGEAELRILSVKPG